MTNTTPNYMDARRAWLRENLGLPPVLQGAPDEKVYIEADPWIVVGTTTVDGDNDAIAAAFGLEVHGLLLESWVDCRACRPPQIDPGSIIEQNYLGHTLLTFTPPPVPVHITYTDDDLRSGLKMVDQAMPEVAQEMAEAAKFVPFWPECGGRTRVGGACSFATPCPRCERGSESLHDKCIWNGAESCDVSIDGRTVTMTVKMRRGVTLDEMEERVRWALPIIDTSGMIYVFREVT